MDPITEYILNETVKLDKFYKGYYDTLPADRKEIFYNPKRGQYHILMLNKEKVGIAGVITNPKHKEFGFFQIYIEKSYRGKNLLKKAAELIYKKYKLKSLIATIKKYNKASIKAHLKAGFIPVEDIAQADLIERGYQKKDEIRLILRK